jgi:hypothetical protein
VEDSFLLAQKPTASTEVGTQDRRHAARAIVGWVYKTDTRSIILLCFLSLCPVIDNSKLFHSISTLQSVRFPGVIFDRPKNLLRLQWKDKMQLSSLASILSLAACGVVAELPAACVLDSLFANHEAYGTTRTCQWWVCGNNNDWRMVRDCGAAATCLEGQPTTCVGRRGDPFRA